VGSPSTPLARSLTFSQIRTGAWARVSCVRCAGGRRQGASPSDLLLSACSLTSRKESVGTRPSVCAIVGASCVFFLYLLPFLFLARCYRVRGRGGLPVYVEIGVQHGIRRDVGAGLRVRAVPYVVSFYVDVHGSRRRTDGVWRTVVCWDGKWLEWSAEC
jgi:hypothetical protein